MGLGGEWMDHQRYLEGYAAVVHSRAGAYPLQGWFERVPAAPNDHPPAPHSQAGGRLHQSPPLRRGLGTPYGNDRGVWTGREVVIGSESAQKMFKSKSRGSEGSDGAGVCCVKRVALRVRRGIMPSVAVGGPHRSY